MVNALFSQRRPPMSSSCLADTPRGARLADSHCGFVRKRKLVLPQSSPPFRRRRLWLCQVGVPSTLSHSCDTPRACARPPPPLRARQTAFYCRFMASGVVFDRLLTTFWLPPPPGIPFGFQYSDAFLPISRPSFFPPFSSSAFFSCLSAASEQQLASTQ